jgi:aminoglycoside phosphotransferase (APT) family kinase protein
MSTCVDYIADPAIPGLPAVLDPLELGEHLREFLPSQTKGLREVQVRPFRHHAGKRCVVEVTGRTTQGSLSWIGKVYAKDRSDVYRLMEEVSRAGFGSSEEFSIPQPTAYIPEWQLLLQEKVEGRPATELFLSGEESERTAAAERCARWLAKFHAIALRVGPSLHLSDHLLSMERWFRRLASMGEPFADKAGELFKRLEAAAAELRCIEMCTIHGDYTHHQVVLAEGRTVTVDWDDYGMADPSQDVARFIVGLQRLALRCLGSIRALDGAAEVFVRTYVASDHSDVTTGLAVQKAAICLEHAKHDVHKQARGWREKAEATLDEGLHVLE